MENIFILGMQSSNVKRFVGIPNKWCRMTQFVALDIWPSALHILTVSLEICPASSTIG